MKANWRQRYREDQDTKIGMEYDKLVELGIRFACIAIHNRYGFGEKRITEIREEINRYIEREINSGTAAHTDARRHNVAQESRRA